MQVMEQLRKTEGTGRKTQIGRKKGMKKGKENIKINEWRKKIRRIIRNVIFPLHIFFAFP